MLSKGFRVFGGFRSPVGHQIRAQALDPLIAAHEAVVQCFELLLLRR